MASPSDMRSESVGLQRFGLGFGLGQSPSIRAGARPPHAPAPDRHTRPPPAGRPVSAAPEIGAALYAF